MGRNAVPAPLLSGAKASRKCPKKSSVKAVSEMDDARELERLPFYRALVVRIFHQL